MHDQEFINQMKSRLLAEKTRVDTKIKQLTAPEDREANPDWDDTANDAMDNVEQESLLRIYRNLQERVDVALKRIEEGTYGLCHECGKEILQEKLAQEPWAEHCSLECAKKHSQ